MCPVEEGEAVFLQRASWKGLLLLSCLLTFRISHWRVLFSLSTTVLPSTHLVLSYRYPVPTTVSRLERVGTELSTGPLKIIVVSSKHTIFFQQPILEIGD